MLGIFWKKCTAAGATAGIIAGLVTTMAYMLWTIDIYGNSEGLFGIPETGFGTVGMLINFAVTIVVSQFTTKPSPAMQALVEDIRYPGKTVLVEAHLAGRLDEVLVDEQGNAVGRPQDGDTRSAGERGGGVSLDDQPGEDRR